MHERYTGYHQIYRNQLLSKTNTELKMIEITVDESGANALIIAAEFGYADLFQRLINECDYDINFTDKQGNSGLTRLFVKYDSSRMMSQSTKDNYHKIIQASLKHSKITKKTMTNAFEYALTCLPIESKEIGQPSIRALLNTNKIDLFAGNRPHGNCVINYFIKASHNEVQRKKALEVYDYLIKKYYLNVSSISRLAMSMPSGILKKIFKAEDYLIKNRGISNRYQSVELFGYTLFSYKVDVSDEYKAVIRLSQVLREIILMNKNGDAELSRLQSSNSIYKQSMFTEFFSKSLKAEAKLTAPKRFV